MSGFMGRIIGKTERMPTILTDVLGKSAPFGEELDVVAEDDADRRMADLLTGLKTRLYDRL
jgi:hypothetical protein